MNENSTMADVADALRTAFNAVTIHEQAFAALPAQIAAQSKAAATQAVSEIVSNETVTGVTAFNAQTGAVLYFPGLGTVNDQLGAPSYTTQQSDNGAKIVVGDSGAVAVTLNNTVQAPWFTIIDNDSSAVATLMPDSGALLYGAQSIPSDGFGIVFFDGTNFWGGASGSAAALPLTIGFVITSGITGTNVGPMLAAPRAGTAGKCVVVTKASDFLTALTFQIYQNGSDVFSSDPTVAAGTSSGTVSTFTALTSSPLTVNAGDVFSINITSGTSVWSFTAQLET